MRLAPNSARSCFSVPAALDALKALDNLPMKSLGVIGGSGGPGGFGFCFSSPSGSVAVALLKLPIIAATDLPARSKSCALSLPLFMSASICSSIMLIVS